MNSNREKRDQEKASSRLDSPPQNRRESGAVSNKNELTRRNEEKEYAKILQEK